MNLYIKYMLSPRCRLTVKDDLEKLGLRWLSMDAGVVKITQDLTQTQRHILHTSLLRSGMELLDEAQSHRLEHLECIIYDMIYLPGEMPESDYRTYLSQKMDQEFSALALFFSEAKGVSIEQYITIQKIERAKEWLLYENMSLREVAQQLRFRSTSHLSWQFKKITGLSPLFFKQLRLIRMNIQDQGMVPGGDEQVKNID